LLEFFVAEVTARSAADLLGIQANSAALFYRKLRELIVQELSYVFPEQGAFEVDESYFGGERTQKELQYVPQRMRVQVQLRVTKTTDENTQKMG